MARKTAPSKASKRASTPSVGKREYEALASFRYALRQFLRFSEEAAHSKGLTPQKHQALLAIRGFPGRERLTIGELAERLQIRHHSAVGLVDRLAAQDLVQREQDTVDRRQVFVSLTRHGSRVLDDLSGTHQNEIHRLRPRLIQLLEDLGQRGVDEDDDEG